MTATAGHRLEQAPAGALLAATVGRDIVPVVNSLRRLQSATGRIVRRPGLATDLLIQLVDPVRSCYRLAYGCDELGQAFTEDVTRWVKQGVSRVAPLFDETLRRFVPPGDGQPAFLIAPMRAPNGPVSPGFFLECFAGLRHDTPEWRELEERHPSPHMNVHSLRLLASSEGFLRGNCIAVFPENIASSVPPAKSFAVCFQNKFHRIFNSITVPIARRVWPDNAWRAAEMSAAEFYRVVCVRSYFHDYFHFSGLRPLHASLELKRQWFPGLIEELKVDCQSVLAALDGALRYGREAAEFVLLERMLRYPAQPGATRSADAGSGVLLFELLAGASPPGIDDGGVHLDTVVPALRSLVLQVQEIEALSDDGSYARATRELARRWLPPGNGTHQFRLPNTYRRAVGNVGSAPHLDFTALDY